MYVWLHRRGGLRQADARALRDAGRVLVLRTVRAQIGLGEEPTDAVRGVLGVTGFRMLDEPDPAELRAQARRHLSIHACAFEV